MKVLILPINADFYLWKTYLFEFQHTNRVKRWSVRAAMMLIRIYQIVLSPLFGSVCRFEPSCSQYAIDALYRYGMIKGTGLAIKRLLRCHPWNSGGFDPVP